MNDNKSAEFSSFFENKELTPDVHHISETMYKNEKNSVKNES